MTARIRGTVVFTDRCFFYYRLHGTNTEQKLSCKARALGDRLFLNYLDAEVASSLNRNIPRKDWPKLRDHLRNTFCDWYYVYYLKFRLENDGDWQNLMNVFIYPTRGYG